MDELFVPVTHELLVPCLDIQLGLNFYPGSHEIVYTCGSNYVMDLNVIFVSLTISEQLGSICFERGINPNFQMFWVSRNLKILVGFAWVSSSGLFALNLKAK